MNEEKKQAMYIALMISMFSGFSLKEISSMSQEEIDSYLVTLRRACKFEEN